MKSIFENLETSLYPITEAELVSHILFGLPSDYESIANSVYVRGSPITYDELSTLLFSSKDKPDTNFRYDNSSRSQQKPRFICQICSKPGHTVQKCFQRYSPSSESTALKSAFITTSSTIRDPSRYLDLGASNHLSTDLQNFSIHNEYNGSDQITVGNGNSLAIDHIVSRSKVQPICPHCQMSKSHKLPFKDSSFVSSASLELVFSDVWGPAPIISNKDFKFYVHFTDHYTKYIWFYPLKTKSEVYDVFNKFKALVESQFDKKIKTLQTDWGGEFRKLSTLGINHRVSCPHTPEQNGATERRHRNIVETGLSLLAAASMPLTYWDDAFATSVYLINKLPTKVLGYISPYQMSISRSPTYLFLKVFGCQCFPYLRPYNKYKFQYRSILCIFTGYSPQYKGYQCLHLPTGRVYISRHVVFDESIFPFTQDALSTNSSSLSSNSNSYSITPSSLVVLPHHDLPPDSLSRPPQLPNSSIPSQTINPMLVSIPSITPSPSPSPSHSPLLPINPCPPSKPVPPPSHHMVTRTKTNSLKPRVF
ncbi:hypothetical protein LIER_25821 [Lithospermum erythrorhizon]|uniref:Integrase catalytic domain-containing protein n=1 Tax=Lithospermum erythrorhizon TaxID=34254 RepID=A0AAV3RA68_LITER